MMITFLVWLIKFQKTTLVIYIAKMRRGSLYTKAQELGCNKLALGHHLDDVVETILMSMFYMK